MDITITLPDSVVAVLALEAEAQSASKPRLPNGDIPTPITVADLLTREITRYAGEVKNRLERIYGAESFAIYTVASPEDKATIDNLRAKYQAALG